jgi:hypothetical protein
MRLLLLKPSIPTHVDEYVAFVLGATVGTVQIPVTLVYGPAVTAYPDQFDDVHPRADMSFTAVAR